MKQLNSAIKSKIFFAIDEYIATIFNTFFSDRRSIPGDENILNALIKYSKIIANDRNAKIIKKELNKIGQKLNSNSKNDLTFPLKVILPENIRTQLKALKTFTKNLEFGFEKKCKESLFDYNKYIDDFDNRWANSLIIYRKISTKNSASVLDVGTGMGYLPYILKYNGYDVTCFDMAGCAEIFNKSCEILGIKKVDFTIKKCESIMNFNKKFDIINATLLCFNQHRETDFWLKDEWLFFLRDIYDNQLNDNGILYLGFNSEIDNKFYLGNDILHDMFDPYIDNQTAVLNKKDIRKIISG